MGRVNDIPDSVSDAGLNHDYNGEAPAEFVLVNAPLDVDYNNIAINRAAVDAYIQGEINAGRHRSGSIANWNPNGPVKLSGTYAEISQFNYARATINGRTWYSFVTVEYVTLEVTRITMVIDVFNSYPNYRIGESDVEQGHVAVAASLNDTFGDQYLTESEPIEVGELETVEVHDWDAFGGAYNVAVISTTTLDSAFAFEKESIVDEPYERVPMAQMTSALGQNEQIPGIATQVAGTIPSGSWPLPGNDASYLVGYPAGLERMPYPWVDGTDIMIPARRSPRPSKINGVPQAGGLYVYASMAAYQYHMSVLARVPWVAEGIQKAYLIPAGLYGAAGADTDRTPEVISNGSYGVIRNLLIDSASLPLYKASVSYGGGDVTLRSNFRDIFVSGIWRKLAVSQFANVEFTDRNGSVMTLAPERIKTNNAGFTFERTAMESGELTLYPNGYGGGSETPLHVGYNSSLPHYLSGFASAFYHQAIPHAVSRGLAVWKYVTEIRSMAYARYASQAQDAFQTVVNSTVSSWRKLGGN